MRTAKILVVEDESVVAWHVQEALHKLGHHVIAIATNARQAIQLAGEHRPDLVLMDICLQGKNDGVSAAEYLYLQLNLPVVYLTAHADEQTLRRATETSPFGYLVKPFQEAELHSTIQIALRRYQLELALKATQQWYATTLVSIGDATIATDVDGFITFMNPAAEFFTGWTQEQALGEFAGRVLDLVHEETRAAIDNPILAALCKGDTITLPDRAILRSRDGSERPVGDSASPIRNRDGEIIGGVMVFQDMSDRRQRESRLNTQNQILETTQLQLFTQLQERTAQVQFAIAIQQLMQRLIDRANSDQPDLLTSVLQEVGQTLGAEHCWLALHDADSTVSTLAATYDRGTPSLPRSTSIEIGQFPQFYLRLFQRQCWIRPPLEVLPSAYQSESLQLMICPIHDHKRLIGEFGIVCEQPQWLTFQADSIAHCISQVVIAHQTHQRDRAAQTKINELQAVKRVQDDFIEALLHEFRTPLTNTRLAIELLSHTVDRLKASESPAELWDKLEQYLQILQQEWREEFDLVTNLLTYQAAAIAEAVPPSEIDVLEWLTIASERLSKQHAISVSICSGVEPLPKILVHLPTLERIFVQLLIQVSQTDSVIQIETFAEPELLHLVINADPNESAEQRSQQMSSRLALVRRFAIGLNATIETDGTAVRLSLPINEY